MADQIKKLNELSATSISMPNTSVFNVGKKHLFDMASVTLDDKLTQILKTQESINQLTLDISKKNILVNNSLSPIIDFAGDLSTSVTRLSDISVNSGLISTSSTYDFINSPIASSINVATNNIISLQNNFLNNFSTSKLGTEISNVNSALNYVTTSTPGLKLHNLSLESLQSSHVFPNIDYLVPAKDENAEKIRLLEKEVSRIKESNNKVIISQVSEELEILLKNLDNEDSEFSKMFRGSMAVMNNPNDDSIAQSAESMTRLLEKLPAALSPLFKPKSKKKEDNIKEMLALYLKIEYSDIVDIKNNLIDQQHFYYETFSQIRHRNKEIYKKYKEDPFLYKALLLQAEGFIYHLLKNKNY